MTTPKNPEGIVREYKLMLDRLYENIPRNAPDEAWLRSSMASLLLWASEQMPKGTNTFRQWSTPMDFAEDLAEQERNKTLEECRTLLTNEARKITDGGKTEEETEKIQALSNMLTFITGKKPNK